MQSREEILKHIQNLMAELFELDASEVVADAKLYEDLDIDSIDAVDLIVELKSFTGRKIAPEEFKSVRTVGDVVEAVEDLLRNG